MVISLMLRSKSLSTKILVSYLVVVICSTTITTLFFRSVLYNNLARRAEIGLTRYASDIIKSITSFSFRDNIDSRSIYYSNRIPFGSGFLESEYVLLNGNGIIIASSRPTDLPVGQSLNDSSLGKHLDSDNHGFLSNIFLDNSYISVKVLVNSIDEQSGYVIAFAQANALADFNRDIIIILIKNMILAALLALPVAVFLAYYIIEPLQKLNDYAKAIAQRRFDVRIDIKSGDELAELAKTFNEMAAQLESYDAGQRRFFQGAAHELKTPLMSIQGYAEGIKDGIFQGEKRDQGLEIIAAQCQRLKKIVDELINISKLQTISEDSVLLPCNLKKISDDVVSVLLGVNKDQKIEIISDFDDEISIIGDPEKIRRIINNILSNAIRHCNSFIWIKCYTDENDREICFSVQDDGMGFSETDLEHAFDYFYKGYKGSSGLGLSIAQILSEEHGGSISITNPENGGARVEVRFPLAIKKDH